MQHLFIPYELAVIAKRKGFEEDCFAFYQKGMHDKKHELCFREENSLNNEMLFNNSGWLSRYFNDCSAPLYQQIVDWFRDKHKINIVVNIGHDEKQIWYNFYLEPVKLGFQYDPMYMEESDGALDYYQCLNNAIKKAFKLI